MSVGSDLLNAPFPDFVVELGTGIAEAQYAMDQVSMRILLMMAGYEFEKDPDTGEVTPKAGGPTNTFELKSGGDKYSLLALGFTPTFYQFVDTILELKMSVSMTTERSSSVTRKSASLKVNPFRGKAKVSSVNANYSQKYQYTAEGSSLMRTKIVTVPPPPLLEEIIRTELLEEDN